MIKFFKIIKFRTATLVVLRDVYSYNPAVPGYQGSVFNHITRSVYNFGGNQYDAAAGFMLVQINTLAENNRAFEQFRSHSPDQSLRNEKQEVFVKNVLDKVILSLPNCSDEASGILNWFKEVVTNYGLEKEYSSVYAQFNH